MAKPGTLLLELWAGSHWSDSWTWFTDDAETSPKDLTNFDATLHIRRKRSDVTPLLTLVSTGGTPAIVLGGAAGTITITITDLVSAGLTELDGWWGLEMEDKTPTPTSFRLLLEGRCIIHPETVF